MGMKGWFEGWKDGGWGCEEEKEDRWDGDIVWGVGMESWSLEGYLTVVLEGSADGTSTLTE
jgi:hypothetical protein